MYFLYGSSTRKLISFPYNEVICEQAKFTTTIYRKTTFSDECSNVECLLYADYESDMSYTLRTSI